MSTTVKGLYEVPAPTSAIPNFKPHQGSLSMCLSPGTKATDATMQLHALPEQRMCRGDT